MHGPPRLEECALAVWQMCGSANGEVSLWDLRHTAEPVRRVALDGGRVTALAFSPQHPRRLAVATTEVRIRRLMQKNFCSDP